MQPEQSPYHFITNADHAPKKSLLSGSSKQGRIIIVAIGVIILITIVLVASTLLSAGSNAAKAELIKTAQAQTEIIRISKLGIDRAKSTSAKNLATTTYLSLQSDQSELLAALGKQGVKLNAKELALGKNAKTDTLLTNAEQSNKFDEVFIKTIQTELTQYQKTVKAAYDKVSGKTLKATLKDQYANANTLAGSK